MSAFGHHGAFAGGAFLDSFGRGPLLLRYGGKEWWFEFSDMFGPQLLRKSDLEPKKRQPVTDDDPFWEAFNAWSRVGRKHRPVWSRRRGKRRLKFYICHADRGEVLV